MLYLTHQHRLAVIILSVMSALAACRTEQLPPVAPEAATAAPVDAVTVPTLTRQTEPTPAPATAAPLPTALAPAEPTPIPTAEPPVEPVATLYDLGDATITQEDLPEDSPFREMPVRLNGVIAAPNGPGPYPVVLIIHGNHPGCLTTRPGEDGLPDWPCVEGEEQFNYQGFDTLVETLAGRGYVALAINANPLYTLSFGESPGALRLDALADLHLSALGQASAQGSDAFGLDLAGKVDLQRMAALGHSQGGEFANIWVRDQGLGQAGVSESRGYGPVYGLLLVAPSAVTVDAPGSTVPTAVILPACDGDVASLDGQRYFEAQRLNPDRGGAWSTSFLLDRANHNAFNAILEDEVAERPDRPDCSVLLAPESQREFLGAYAGDFFDSLFALPTEQAAALGRLGLDPRTPAPAALYDFTGHVSTMPMAGDQLALLVPRGRSETSQNLLGGGVQADSVSVRYCEAGYYTPITDPGTEPCRRVSYNQPGNPSQFILNWNKLDAALRVFIPDGGIDTGPYDAVSLRVAVDPLSPLNAPDVAQTFSLRLSDGEGKSASVVLGPSEPALAFPSGARGLSNLFSGVETYTGHVHMSDIRVPLSAFEGIDLANIAEVALVFDQSDSGALLLGDLSFVAAPRLAGASSTLLSNADGSLDSLKGIGRFNGEATCTGTLIDTGGPDDPAYIITNGHCAQEWLANDVLTDLPATDMTMRFNYFADTQDAQVTVPARTIVYSTMKGRDVAIVELDTTLGALAEAGVEPFPLAQGVPETVTDISVIGAPAVGLPQDVAFLRQEDCSVSGRTDAYEFIWHFNDLYRNDCQDIYGGSSGSPVFAGEDEAILALINTTTIGGLTPCYLGAPCEAATGAAVTMRPDTSYATPVDGLGGCFVGGRFELSAATCPLDDGRQLLLSGYPSGAGQEGGPWNATLTGDLPFYRFKAGPIGSVDCRDEAGYGVVTATADRPVIDDLIPSGEGHYLLCVLAGETEAFDESWQPSSDPTVARAEIDRTPPTIKPELFVRDYGEEYYFEPIFAVAELSAFDVKWGPAETTDCDDPEGYVPYRRFGFSTPKADDPQVVCVIGIDVAGNRSVPWVYPLGEPAAESEPQE
jgi:hypothetical protein